MKKNLSFLKKSSLLLGLSLFSVASFAQAPTKPTGEKIWANTPEVKVGDYVTFTALKSDGKTTVVYNGSGSVATFEGKPSSGKGIGFNVVPGKNYGTGAGQSTANIAFQDPTTKMYFNEDGQMETTDVTSEITWNVGSNEVYSVAKHRYVYYNETGNLFKTTVDNSSCGIYKQFDVVKPYFTANKPGTYPVVVPETSFIVTVSCDKGSTTLISGNEVEYQIIGVKNGDTKVTTVEGTTTSTIDLSKYITKLSATSPKSVTLKVRTAYEGGVTSWDTYEYTLVEMNPITFSAVNNTNNRVADNGKYVVTAKSDKATLKIGAPTLANGATIDIADKAKFQDEAVKVTVNAEATRFGATITNSKVFDVYTNALPSELFGTFVTEAEWNASPLNICNANKVNTAWYDLTTNDVSKKYTLSYDIEKAKGITLTAEGSDPVAPKAVNFKNGKLEITIPYSIRNTKYTVSIPEGVFVATSKSGANKFSNVKEESGDLYAEQAEVTFNIDPDRIMVEVPANDATLKVPFNVWPVNSPKTINVDAKAGEGLSIDVAITKINNDTICMAKATKVDGKANEFEVVFAADADYKGSGYTISKFLEESSVDEPGVLVAFPANSLVSDDDYQNIDVITSRMIFVEAVEIVPEVDADTCAHDGKIEVAVKATGKVSGKYYESKLTTADSKLKINGKDCAIVRTAVDEKAGDTYTIDITKLKNGDYTVNFPAETFSAFYSKSASVDCDFHVYAHPTFKFEPKLGVKNESLSIEVKATVPEGFDFKDGDLRKINDVLEDDTVMIDGKKFLFSSTDVNKANQTITLTIKDATKDILKDGVSHSIVFEKDMFKAAGNTTCLSEKETVPYEVKPWVSFSTDPYNLVKIDTKDTEVTFPVYLKRGANKDEYNDADLKAKGYLTYNDGTSEAIQYAEITKVVPVGKDGEYTVTAKLKHTLAARANNYELYVAKDSLYADNYNFEDFSVSFKVYNHIEITAESPIDLTTTDKVATIEIKGYDEIDEADATVNIELVKDTKFDLEGKGQVVPKYVTYGQYTIDLGKGLAAGTYTVTIPAKAVVANASKNDEALTVTLRVEDFDPKDTVIGDDVKEFDIQISENTVITVAENDKVTLTRDSEKIDATIVSNNNGTVKVKMNQTLTRKYDAKGNNMPYTLTFPVASIHGQYADNSKELTCEVLVEKYFAFVNNVNEKSTLNSELPATATTYDLVTYTQNIKNIDNLEPISLPFDIEDAKTVFGDTVTIYRINVIYQGQDGKTKFNLIPLKENETMFANKPYVIKSERPTIKVDLEDVVLQQATATTINCSTTKEFFAITNTYDATIEDIYEKVEAENDKNVLYYISGGALNHSTSTAKGINAYKEVKIWRWVAEGSAINPDYVKMQIVDEEDATAINAVNADADNTIYNIAGQKLQSAQKGINIINGKKVLVK